VVFVEYSTADHTKSQMYAHFWDVFRANGGGNSVTTPMIMVDEFQHTDGRTQNFEAAYSDMVDRALRRRPGAHIDAAFKQVGNDVQVEARIINKLGKSLSATTDKAQVHALVWTEQKKYYSPHSAIVDASGGLCATIEDGAMATCKITIPGVNATGPIAHVLVMLDYLPDPTVRKWDMIQTASAVQGELPPPPNANLPPEIFAPIPDVTVEENAEPTVIDLSGVFVDPDDDNSAITKMVLGNTNPNLVAVNLTGNSLTLSYSPNMTGSSEIRVRATSNEQSVDDFFTVTVAPKPDLPPTVANPIADQRVEEGSAPFSIDLSQVFTDPDDDPSAILIRLTENSNPGLAWAAIEGRSLKITIAPTGTGVARIMLRAESDGKTVDEDFTITVLPREGGPSIYLPALYRNH
jgi:hypothetical protein